MGRGIFTSFLVFVSCALSAATITVTNPTSTSSWRIGTTQEIRWTHSGFTNPESRTVTLRLRRGTTIICDIATGVPLTAGRYSWALSTATCAELATGRYSVRVRIPAGETGDSPEFEITPERLHPVVQAIPVRSISVPMLDGESWGWESIFTRVGDTTHGSSRPVPECKLGDQGDDTQYMTYLSFDLAQIDSILPSGATIKQALLLLKRKSTSGNPFQELYNFQVARTSYQRMPTASTGTQGALLFDRQCPCREVDAVGIDVTVAFNLLRAADNPRLQVRLQFMQPGNRDGGPDLVEFEKGANGCKLIVKYQE